MPRIIQLSFQREDEDMGSSLYTQRQKEVIRIRIFKSGTIWSANKHFKFVRASQAGQNIDNSFSTVQNETFTFFFSNFASETFTKRVFFEF